METLNTGSREQLRYESKENPSADESLVIRNESENESIQGNKRKKQSFPKEFIKNLPNDVIQMIVDTRSDCIGSFSRETRMLSRNNSYKGTINELKKEIEGLREEIGIVRNEGEVNVKKAVKKAKKPLKIELQVIREAR